MKLYFHPMTRAMTPRLLVEELGIACEIVDIDFHAREHKSAHYLGKHPLGQLPCLELDDGTTVFETAAVCLYLAEQAPASGLHVPPGDPRRGRYLSFMCFGIGSIEPAVQEAYNAQQVGDDDKLAVARQRVAETVAVVGQQLGDKQWLFGDDFTAADLLMGSTIQWLAMMKHYEPRGTIGAFVARFLDRPAIQRIFGQYYGG